MDRRSLLRAAGVAGLVVAASAAAGAAAAADPLSLARYRALVPEIFEPLADAPDFTDAVVIGSGFGGAVAAHRLAAAGVAVTVLERGSRWPTDPHREIFTGDGAPDGRAFWHRTSGTGLTGRSLLCDDFGGVVDSTSYPGVRVMRGAAVGGGSVVYTGATVEPEQRLFEAVFAGSGVDWAEMHHVHYPRARAALGVSPMPDDIYRDQAFSHSRTWDAQVSRAGYTPQRIDGAWHWPTVRDEIDGRVRRSATIGESTFGNGNGAKLDLTRTYLRRAEATGRAKVYPGHQVLAIAADTAGRYTVTVNKIDPTGAVLATRTIGCRRLFLAGGSIGTTELLLAAQASGALPNLNEHVGRGWGTNGDTFVVRTLNLGGLTQGSPCASRILDEQGLPVTLENWYMPGLVLDTGLIASLGMVLDPTRGTFTHDTTTGAMVLSWPGQPDAVAAVRAVNKRVAEANGSGIGIGPLAPDVASSFTAHPLGGAVIGRVSDAYGRVEGHPGLYVIDGAGIPGSTGTANPSLTITALAERTIEKIIADGG